MMKRFIFVSVFALFALMCFQSCLTDRKIANNCERFYEVCGTPERAVEYRDTSFNIQRDIMSPAPKDSIHASAGLVIDSGGDIIFSNGDNAISFGGKYIKSDLKIIDNRLVLDSYIHADSIPISIDMEVNLHNAIKEIKDTNVIRIKYIPKAYRWSLNFVISSIIILIFFMAFKFNLFGFKGFIGGAIAVVKKFF